MEFKGSTHAAAALIARKADMSLVGRPMLPEEVAAFERTRGYDLLTLRVAGGTYRGEEKLRSIAVLVNKANPIDRLSLDQIDAIDSKTRKRGLARNVTTWGALGLGGEWANQGARRQGGRRSVHVHEWHQRDWGGSRIRRFAASTSGSDPFNFQTDGLPADQQPPGRDVLRVGRGWALPGSSADREQRVRPQGILSVVLSKEDQEAVLEAGIRLHCPVEP